MDNCNDAVETVNDVMDRLRARADKRGVQKFINDVDTMQGFIDEMNQSNDQLLSQNGSLATQLDTARRAEKRIQGDYDSVMAENRRLSTSITSLRDDVGRAEKLLNRARRELRKVPSWVRWVFGAEDC